MLTEKNIQSIENTLNHYGSIYYHSTTETQKENSRRVCQGIAIVLHEIGYEITWKNEKAKIQKEM